MESRGIDANGSSSSYKSDMVNCYFGGILGITISGTWKGQSGILSGDYSTFNNCYYLNGAQGETGLVAQENVKVFYETSDDEEVMTSATVVEKLNKYIDDHKNDESAATNTSTWLKWRVGANGLPELIFE